MNLLLKQTKDSISTFRVDWRSLVNHILVLTGGSISLSNVHCRSLVSPLKLTEALVSLFRIDWRSLVNISLELTEASISPILHCSEEPGEPIPQANRGSDTPIQH